MTVSNRSELSLGRLGALEVRLAQCHAEVRLAQRLRHRVFFEERHGASSLTQHDVDRFDRACDHLLVIDHAAPAGEAVVGTYRLLRQEVAARHGGFYSASEFDIGGLVASAPGARFLELGRSCVLAPYRNRRTLELLWHGIAAYTERDRCDVMFGCASFEGTDIERLRLPLSFLHHHARTAGPWHVGALPHRRISMDLLPRDEIDINAALRALPPLIRGYLRLGAMIGDGAVIDRGFETTDVLIVLPMAAIGERYYAHFGARRVQVAA